MGHRVELVVEVRDNRIDVKMSVSRLTLTHPLALKRVIGAVFDDGLDVRIVGLRFRQEELTAGIGSHYKGLVAPRLQAMM